MRELTLLKGGGGTELGMGFRPQGPSRQRAAAAFSSSYAAGVLRLQGFPAKSKQLGLSSQPRSQYLGDPGQWRDPWGAALGILWVCPLLKTSLANGLAQSEGALFDLTLLSGASHPSIERSPGTWVHELLLL